MIFLLIHLLNDEDLDQRDKDSMTPRVETVHRATELDRYQVRRANDFREKLGIHRVRSTGHSHLGIFELALIRVELRPLNFRLTDIDCSAVHSILVRAMVMKIFSLLNFD